MHLNGNTVRLALVLAFICAMTFIVATTYLLKAPLPIPVVVSIISATGAFIIGTRTKMGGSPPTNKGG